MVKIIYKKCCVCGEIKEQSEFCKHRRMCKTCRKEDRKKYDKKYHIKNKKKIKEYRKQNKKKIKEHREKNKDKSRDYHLKRKHNITYVEYLQMVDKQNNVCAICNKPEVCKRQGNIKLLAVDHSHKTGEIRGLLCYACNSAIGYAKESTEVLKQAITYINDTSEYFIKPIKISSPKSLGTRATALMYKYHITMDKYNKLAGIQNHTCKICRQPETKKLKDKLKPLSVNHTRNIIRGLLCN